MIQEHLIKLPIEENSIVSKELDIFYNRIMSLNRSITILMIKSYFQDQTIRIADILAGTGIRTLRLIKELLQNKEYFILVNDKNPKLNEVFEQGLKLNFNDDEIKEIQTKILVTNKDANLALNENKFFDYIDVDPFGSPNPFLDTSIQRIKNKGMIAITATDTAPLSGTYPKACKRKYYANPLRNHLMHEIGLRILIRKAQLIGMQYDKALIPVLSLSTHHYMRVFFKIKKSKEECNNIVKQHQFIDENAKIIDKDEFGKIWTGNLYDKELIKNMLDNDYEDKELNKTLNKIFNEYDCLGFVDTHEISSKYKIEIKKIDKIISELKKKGFEASRTHIKETGIKTNANIDDILKVINT